MGPLNITSFGVCRLAHSFSNSTQLPVHTSITKDIRAEWNINMCNVNGTNAIQANHKVQVPNVNGVKKDYALSTRHDSNLTRFKPKALQLFTTPSSVRLKLICIPCRCQNYGTSYSHLYLQTCRQHVHKRKTHVPQPGNNNLQFFARSIAISRIQFIMCKGLLPTDEFS